MFFIHLALEKIIKAHVCRVSGDLAPRIHNLSRLAGLSGVSISKDVAGFLAELNKYTIEGRYSDTYEEVPDSVEIETILTESERIFTWLHDQL